MAVATIYAALIAVAPPATPGAPAATGDPFGSLAGTLNGWRGGLGALVIALGVIFGVLRCLKAMRSAPSGDAVLQGLVPIGAAIVLAGWIVAGNAVETLYRIGASIKL